MKLKIKFGLVGIIVGVVLGLFLYFLATTPSGELLPNWLDIGDLLARFFPFLFYALLQIGMGDTPLTVSETIITLSFGIIFSIITYFAVGFIIGFIYEQIRDRISRKVAILTVILILLLIPSAMIYIEYQEYKRFYHIGETPADCAELEESRQGWCYRTLYREYSIPEVCSHPGLTKGESEECAKRFGVKSGSVAACSVFDKIELKNYCKWGVAVANKNTDLCKELPNDDEVNYTVTIKEVNYTTTQVLSTQESCMEVITKYWQRNIDFFDK